MSPKFVNAFIFVVVFASSLVIFANTVTKPLEPDELTYCTAAALLSQGKMIYRDFSYASQMPYHPLLCAALYRLFNTTHFLLVARLFSCLCDILVLVCIVDIYRRLFRSFPLSAMLLTFSAAVLYVFNPFIDYISGLAWNNNFILFSAIMSLWLFISIDFSSNSKYWRIAAIGVLLTLASCMRITVALVQMLFFIFILTRHADSVSQRIKTILPFLIASFVVAVWPLYVIALAPRVFFINLYRVSMLNSQWLHEIGMFYSKPYMIFHFITIRGCFALILIAIYLCVAILLKRKKQKKILDANFSLALMLVLLFFVIALMMPTMWEQHLAMLVPFIVVSFAFPLLYLRKLNPDVVPNNYFKMGRVLMIACAVAVAASYPHILRRVPKLFDLQNWAPLHLHHISEDIAQRTKDPKLILTLAPLYALEGGCDIYTEFSSGAFVYRVAHLLSPSDRRLINTVSFEEVTQMIEKSPPSALIIGIESEFLEDSLLNAVAPNPDDWEVKIYENGPKVYFRR